MLVILTHMNTATTALVNKVISITNAIVNNNTCPSVMAEVPKPFALIVIFAYSFMLGCFPALSLWEILYFKCMHNTGDVMSLNKQKKSKKEILTDVVVFIIVVGIIGGMLLYAHYDIKEIVNG